MDHGRNNSGELFRILKKEYKMSQGSRSSQMGGIKENVWQAFVPGPSQKVTTSGSSAACTNAFTANCNIVRLICDQDCYIVFAASPTAAATDMFLPASTPEYFGLSVSGLKVAAIQATAGGTLYITEGLV